MVLDSFLHNQRSESESTIKDNTANNNKEDDNNEIFMLNHSPRSLMIACIYLVNNALASETA